MPKATQQGRGGARVLPQCLMNYSCVKRPKVILGLLLALGNHETQVVFLEFTL